jgi:hypothetical protein
MEMPGEGRRQFGTKLEFEALASCRIVMIIFITRYFSKLLGVIFDATLRYASARPFCNTLGWATGA